MKISLTTVILLFIILALIIALGIVYYLGFVKNEQIQEQTNKNQISTQQPTNKVLIENNTNVSQNVVSEETNNKENEKTEENYSKTQLIELLKEVEQVNEKEFLILRELRVKAIEEINGKYIITAKYYVPEMLTEDVYNKMYKEGKILLDNKEYIFKNDEGLDIFGIGSKGNSYGQGYLMLNENQEYTTGYYIKKIDEGYVLMYAPGAGNSAFVKSKIEKTIKFEADKDTKVYNSTDYQIFNSIDELIDKDLNNMRVTIELDTDKKDICIFRDPR